MAYTGILECFQQEDKWFTGVVVTNGSGSPRDDVYKNYTDDEMRIVRRKEQKKAAFVGEYAAQALLDYPSSAIKDTKDLRATDDMLALLTAAKPRVRLARADRRIGAGTARRASTLFTAQLTAH